MKLLLMRFSLLLASIVGMTLLSTSHAYAYTDTHLMDDVVFDGVGSLSQQQIADFLAGNPGPYTKLATASPCLSNALTPNFAWDGTHWHYGDVTNAADPLYANSAWNSSLGPNNISVSSAIYKAAQQWGLNPEVLLATIQKESSLITGADCAGWRFNSALGYDCPDTLTLQDYPYINIMQTCVRHEKNAGFSKQLLWGSWQLKFNKERSLGNTPWDGDGDITYVGYMTQGTRARCATCTATYFNGNATIDGQTILLETGATASLYTYTPHLGQSFPGIFEGWFGLAVLPTYSWQVAGQYAYADQTKTVDKSTQGIVAGDRVYVGFTVKNTGTATWSNSGPNAIKVGTLAPTDRISLFCDSWSFGCNRPTTMIESSVPPGGIATFEFWMRAPQTAGAYNERFGIVAEGIAWLPDLGLNFYSTVIPAVYSWQLNGQYAYTSQSKTIGHGTQGLVPGDRVYVGFTARNTGNITWYNSGPNPINIGMTHPQDRPSAFYDSSWIGTNRPTRLKESSVAPGAIGTFEFWINAPNTPGAYPEYFSLVAEGRTWMNDPGMNFFATVLPAVYSWQMVWQYAYADQTKTVGKGTVNLAKGDRVFVGFIAKNTGNTTWYNSGSNPINVGMTHPQDRFSPFYDASWIGSNRSTRLMETSVAPGQNGTFEFWMNSPQTLGSYSENFSLLAEGRTWMNDPGMNFYATVTH
jgi:predicted small integral membrane protein